MPLRTRTQSAGNASYRFKIIDDRPVDLHDVSHAVLALSWPATLGAILGVFLLLNALFAQAFVWVGGVENAAPGSFKDAFFFSVQTMATIGYGAMYPHSDAAEALVVLESMVGLVVTAIATGLVFVRFARVRGRVVFSKQVALGLFDGKPHLQIRVGNGRSNRIFDAQFRLMLVRTVKTAEQTTLYRTSDLELVRDHAPTLQRAWNLLHLIDESSPLFGATPELLASQDAEIQIAITGTDETTLQPVHGRYTWETPSFAWGMRLADVLSESPEGDVVLDLRHFDEVVPTAPVEGFPFPRPQAG